MTNINHGVVIKATAAVVYEALTTQEGIAGWWNKEIIAKPQVGFVNMFKVEVNRRNTHGIKNQRSGFQQKNGI